MIKTLRSASRLSLFASSVSVFALPLLAAPALAQTAPGAATEDEIVVTGTRREISIQDVPLNIAVVGAREIEEQGLDDLTELSSYVPGLHIIDQGGHAAHPIIVRGLNADPIGSNDGSNDGGGTVATYVGEIPLFIDMRLEDMERVEVLLGPQGTLYGSGTLGGAIRYIPRRPSFSGMTFSVRGEVYDYSEGSDLSSDFGATLNVPLAPNFAIRASIDQLNDSGFIDYDFIVQEIGVSDPDGFATDAERAANLAPVEDANDEDVLSGRIAARWAVTPDFEATLTYYFQNSDVGGRQISAHRGLIDVPEYTSTKRVRETFERDNELLALEAEWDIGFATLTSASGFSRYNDSSQRDQTDLLLMLNPLAASYYYDNFPSFTARTRDISEEETFTQELRLVSQGQGPLTWIVGAFYSDHEEFGDSREFTPEFSQYLVDNYGAAFRSDALEYIAVSTQDLTESAVYGEIGYDFTPRWNVTVGGRWYEYDLTEFTAVDLPLLNTAYFGQPDGVIVLDFEETGQSDEGFLWKFNTSYDFTDDFMAYFTRSEGYRIGNSNGLEACVVPPDPGQNVCAQPDELQYTSDTTINYELGMRSQFMQGRVTLNAAIYYIDWTDPQIASATLIGTQPITINAPGAETQGFEVNFNAQLTERFSVRGSYSNTVAKLTEAAPIITELDLGTLQPIRSFAQAGDRLPGAPEHQGSLYFTYEMPMGDLDWTFSYGLSAISEVLSRTGGRGGGLTLPSYSIHNLSAQLASADWTLRFYVNNLFDELAETGVVSTSRNNLIFTDDGGGPVYVRSFYTDVGPPRQIGLRFSYEFGE
jgi:outer membrane receptor protein involved in Fe transport